MAARTWARMHGEEMARARFATLRLFHAGRTDRKTAGSSPSSEMYQPTPKPSPLRGSRSRACALWRIKECSGSVSREASRMGGPRYSVNRHMLRLRRKDSGGGSTAEPPRPRHPFGPTRRARRLGCPIHPLGSSPGSEAGSAESASGRTRFRTSAVSPPVMRPDPNSVMPVGLQVVGRRFGEGQVLGAARVIQDAHPIGAPPLVAGT